MDTKNNEINSLETNEDNQYALEGEKVEFKKSEPQKEPGKNKFFNNLKEKGANIYKGTREILNDIKLSSDFKKELKKEFENKTYVFTEQISSFSFRGFKKPTEDIIYFEKDTKDILKYIKADVIIIRSHDNVKFKVLSVETKQTEIDHLNINGIESEIFLDAIYVKPYVIANATSVINNITQNTTITGSIIGGNVQQINDLTNRLNDFEGQLLKIKPTIFNKQRYNEAVKIYGDVKESIINGQKDDSIVKKFKDLISVFTTIYSAFLEIIKS